ncbi:MAG: hypothetical protein HYX51_01165 [Chloroflexi bacterium]|nr:hypothetical protein [Chloroflexota bacterium]
MARGLEPIIPDLSKAQSLPPMDAFVSHYDIERDVLSFQLGNPRPAVSIDIDGEFWVRYVPETGEIVGFEIEDFVRVYLIGHPDILATAVEAAFGGPEQSAEPAKPKSDLVGSLVAATRRYTSSQGGPLPV